MKKEKKKFTQRHTKRRVCQPTSRIAKIACGNSFCE
jgi:hypothetical protein